MKITCGLGSVDDYERYCMAGADECFFGYVPGWWMDAYGEDAPLNRREVLYYNVQLGAMSELMILRDMSAAMGVPVTMALNATHFTKAQRAQVYRVVEEGVSLGVHDYIVADEALICDLYQRYGTEIRIHLSGEFGELNHLVLQALQCLPTRDGTEMMCRKSNVKRVIFPRQTTMEEMAEMIRAYPSLEYEAFVLNEKCHYTGAYCNSVHCDEFCHACRIPYVLSGPEGVAAGVMTDMEEADEMIPGASGCGLCALWRLGEIGITHLKLVSRGNDGDSTVRDIQLVRRALDLLAESPDEAAYIALMKAQLFPDGCGENCYYK